MARVFFITPQWHSMCVLRFWFLWEALSSPHKRRTTYEMEIRFSFVKGLNTKTLISLVAPILRSSHLLPTAARVQERKAWEVQKVLMHKMPPNRRGRNAFLLFFSSLVRLKPLLGSLAFRSPLARSGKKTATAAQAMLKPCDSDHSSYPAI